MKRFPIAAAAAVAVLGSTALIAAPTLADANHSGSGAPAQLAHMGQSQGMGQGQGMGSGYGMGKGQGMGPGYGMGQGQGMGPGMMMGTGFGMGPGMMGSVGGAAPCAGITTSAGKVLGADDVRASLERSLDWHGNKRLKVGEVIETDDNTVVAEIVTVDDSLVQRLEVDRQTGRMQQVN